MASFEEKGGFEELETLLWQARVKESVPSYAGGADKAEEGKTVSDKATSTQQK